MNNIPQTQFKNPWLFRGLSILIISVAVLGSAAGCTIPGFNSGTSISLGVLKHDPSVKADGFGRINTVNLLNGQNDGQGLSSISGLKLVEVNKDNLFLLTKQKGLFKTSDGGRTWKRLYIFSLPSTNTQDQAVQTAIAKNDSFIAADVSVDQASDGSIIYVSGKYNTIGKIFMSTDGGSTFSEIYSEVTQNIGVQFVAVNPRNKSQILAILEGGALIRSTDDGKTWQKVRSFADTPVGLGFVSNFDNQAYAIFKSKGFFTSTDQGVTWLDRTLTKSTSAIGEGQPKDSLSIGSAGEKFGSYEKAVPVVAAKGAWILIADRQMWYSDSLDKQFSKLVLPLQNEQYNLLDVEPDPIKGMDRVYVSVDNKLFYTINRGQSWSTGDQIGLSTPIGNIGEIQIDPNDTNVIYLMLVDPSASRGTGLFGGF